MVQNKYIPYREIAGALKIQPGDAVLLTSDILKLAMKARKKEKVFNTSALLNSFVEELGAEGTLLLPAYNFDLENGDAYDVAKTIPMTGALAVAALEDRTFARTYNPLHSFLVKGRDSSILAGMRNTSSFGIDSPFAWMYEHNVLMVFAGTTPAEAMTFTHFVEESDQVWYRRYKNLRINYNNAEGNLAILPFRIYAKKPGWTTQMEKLEKLFSAETLQQYSINGIPFYTIRCRDAYEVISSDIRENNARSIAAFNMKLYLRDVIKSGLQQLNLFRTTYGKIRSAKRIH